MNRHPHHTVPLVLLAAVLIAGCTPSARRVPPHKTTTTTTVATTTTTASTTTTTVAPTTTTTTVPEGPTPPLPGSWRLAFADEFNGTTLDLGRWTPCFSWAWTYDSCTWSFNNGRESYQPRQVRLVDGVARLTAQPDDATGTKYRSGLLSTTNRPMSTGDPASLFKFRYGYVEARMKLPRERGMFTAFWLLPPDYDRWQYPYEIDILEHLGGGDAPAYMHVHHSGRSRAWTPNWSPAPNGACPTIDVADGFHTYAVDWQPAHIDFYIDGVRCGRFTGPIWDGDLEIIVNLMVDVDWQRFYPYLLTVGPTTASLDIDHIRVWQRA